MTVRLTIQSETVSPERLQEMTLDFRQTLTRETGILATVPQESVEPGARGDPITIGALILTFLTSGAAVALCEVVKAFFERNSTLTIEFEREDGRKLKINSENFQADQVERTLSTVKGFFAKSP